MAKRVKAVGAVDRRTGRLEGAVLVDAGQQDAVLPTRFSARGHGNVRVAAHLEHVGAVGAV